MAFKSPLKFILGCYCLKDIFHGRDYKLLQQQEVHVKHSFQYTVGGENKIKVTQAYGVTKRLLLKP